MAAGGDATKAGRPRWSRLCSSFDTDTARMIDAYLREQGLVVARNTFDCTCTFSVPTLALDSNGELRELACETCCAQCAVCSVACKSFFEWDEAPGTFICWNCYDNNARRVRHSAPATVITRVCAHTRKKQ